MCSGFIISHGVGSSKGFSYFIILNFQDVVERSIKIFVLVILDMIHNLIKQLEPKLSRSWARSSSPISFRKPSGEQLRSHLQFSLHLIRMCTKTSISVIIRVIVKLHFVEVQLLALTEDQAGFS